jgi:alanine racemase
VALVEEGVELRRAGVRAPILVFGTAQEAQLPVFRRHRLVPGVSSLAQLALWREFSARGNYAASGNYAAAGGDSGFGAAGPQPIHLEVDTGMSRLGVPAEEAAAALDLVRRSPQLALAGLMSHGREGWTGVGHRAVAADAVHGVDLAAHDRLVAGVHARSCGPGRVGRG